MTGPASDFPSAWSVRLRFGLLALLGCAALGSYHWQSELNLKLLSVDLGSAAFSAVPGVLAVVVVLTSPWRWYRLFVALAGTFLILATATSVMPDGTVYLPDLCIFGGATLFGFALCLLLRAFGMSVEQLPLAIRATAPPRIRFTIRQLLLFTTLAAVAVAVPNGWRNFEAAIQVSKVVSHVAFGLMISIPLAATASLGAWCALGRHRIRWQLALVLIPMACLGLPLNLLFQVYGLWFWPLLTLETGVFAFLALLIVRSCGYRLMRHAAREIPAEGVAVHELAA